MFSRLTGALSALHPPARTLISADFSSKIFRMNKFVIQDINRLQGVKLSLPPDTRSKLIEYDSGLGYRVLTLQICQPEDRKL